MERIREARRGSMAASANGLPRRRHRSNSLRDSPEQDGQVELQESARLRDRGVKKDRERERDRDRDRDRDRSSRSKRRRGDRLLHGSNRDDGGEDSSEESVNDEEDDEEEEGGSGGGGTVRMLPPNPVVSMSSSLSTHHHQHRKSFPPSHTTKVFRPAPGWKPTDEMIGFSVPRKARTASTKRSHELCISGSGVGGEQIQRQASTSPGRSSLASAATHSPAPVSPSSSNVSVRKKPKSNGPKPRPPKSSSKSLNPEELEIEIAEVLYGLMRQSQGPSKKEIMVNDSAKFDLKEVNKSSSDAKSRVSSPISNSTSTAPQSSSVLPQNSSSSATPISAVAPKRKRPRQVSDNLGSFSFRHSHNPISSTTTTMKVEIDQPPKTEVTTPNLEKNPAENGSVPHDFTSSAAVPPSSESQPDSARPEAGSAFSDSKPVTEQGRESGDVGPTKEEEVTSPKKESLVVRVVRPDDDREDATATKATSTTISEIESPREEKYQIDLMAPPPHFRSSPEREGRIDFVAGAEQKPVVANGDSKMRPMTKDKEDQEELKSGRDEAVKEEPEQKILKVTAEEAESEKPSVSKGRSIDLQLDLKKLERDISTSSLSGNKLHSHVQKQQLQQQQPKGTRDEPLRTEKTAQSSPLPLPLPMSLTGWPGGLPPMGYMAPLQGVVSMDGNTVSPTSIQPLFSQPRPKRCATHCYIARNIHYLQQIAKMNPFWPAAAGSASIFGAKPCNLNVVPSAELHGNIAGRNVNPVQDKGHGLPIFPGLSVKDKGSQAVNIADAQRKQTLPPAAPPSNILHGPAFLIPLNQQQAAAAAAAASVRPGSFKSSAASGSVASTNTSNSASVSGSVTASPAATAVSFNYPNMPASETQYLAILQNNAYPFPLPAVGAPPPYRGTHGQAMPYFNGAFYSSQIIQPSQLQQQQPSPQPPQVQQGHQNTYISNGSLSSQKHLPSQQQRPQSSNTNGGNGSANLHGFPAPKNRPLQVSQQQQLNQHMQTSHQVRRVEAELGGEDSPSNSDSHVSRPSMSVYGQNFAVPIHPQNFAWMTSSSALADASVGNLGEKKQQQQLQQQGLKAGVESLPSQTFSFPSMNGVTTAPGIDISSVAAQNHAVLHSLPEATRHSFQIMAAAAAAQAAQQKKNFGVSEESKTGGSDSSNADEEMKGLAGKAPATVGQCISFSKPDSTDASVSNIPGSTLIDSSARTLNLVSAPPRTSRSAMQNAMGTVNTSTPNSQLQAQMQYQQQQHQQHMVNLQKIHHHQQQQIAAVAASLNKTPATSNGSLYSDHLASSPAAAAAKYPNAHSALPQNFVQNSSPAQSPQWKNSSRTTSQVPSSLTSSTTSSLKKLPQQPARTQQSHTQISFGVSQKSSTAPQGQQAPNSHQASSPPMVVGSPTTSISKGSGGSPRTATSTSAGNKAAPPSTLSSQQSKNSAPVASRKSSPVGGRNVPSILGNPHITSSSTTGAKPQMQQQQLHKQSVPQPQLFFSSAYMQAQATHSTGASSPASTTSGYYLQRRRPEQQQQSQQPQGSSATPSTGMLSLCSPVSTSDAKSVAAASNMKGGGFPSQGILHPTQFMSHSSGNSHHLVPPGFPYVPAAVQVNKPAEQKQPAGNNNMHACWQPEKK